MGLQSSNWEKEQEIHSKVEALSQQLASYHDQAEELALIPSTAKNAKGRDYFISIDSGRALVDGNILGDQKIKGYLVKHLNSIKETVIEKTREFRENLLILMDEEEELDNQLAEVNETLHQEESKAKRLEDEYGRKKEEYEAMKLSHERILNQLNEKMNDTRNSELASLNQQIEVLKLHLFINLIKWQLF